MIRRARTDDLNRIAEIEVFNYRLQFYPIFRSDEFYFGELQVPNVANRYADSLEDIRVWDDGVVKGFILVRSGEIKKLFVEPVLQGHQDQPLRHPQPGRLSQSQDYIPGFCCVFQILNGCNAMSN